MPLLWGSDQHGQRHRGGACLWEGRLESLCPQARMCVCVDLLWLGHLHVYVGACTSWRVTGSLAVVLYLVQKPPLLQPFLPHTGKMEEFYAIGSLRLAPNTHNKLCGSLCLCLSVFLAYTKIVNFLLFKVQALIILILG